MRKVITQIISTFYQSITAKSDVSSKRIVLFVMTATLVAVSFINLLTGKSIDDRILYCIEVTIVGCLGIMGYEYKQRNISPNNNNNNYD